jgi:hypothetical protein
MYKWMPPPEIVVGDEANFIPIKNLTNFPMLQAEARKETKPTTTTEENKERNRSGFLGRRMGNPRETEVWFLSAMMETKQETEPATKTEENRQFSGRRMGNPRETKNLSMIELLMLRAETSQEIKPTTKTEANKQFPGRRVGKSAAVDVDVNAWLRERERFIQDNNIK